MRSRSRVASTGAAPPLLIAMTSGERSTIAGTMKVESSASSTTLTSTFASRAAAATRALTCAMPRRPRSTTRAPRSIRVALKSVGSPTTVIGGRPPSRSSRTLRSATSPPPTTRTGGPAGRERAGSSAWVASNARPVEPVQAALALQAEEARRLGVADLGQRARRVPVADRDVALRPRAGGTAGRACAGSR